MHVDVAEEGAEEECTMTTVLLQNAWKMLVFAAGTMAMLQFFNMYIIHRQAMSLFAAMFLSLLPSDVSGQLLK